MDKFEDGCTKAVEAYHSQVEKHEDFVLEILIEHYELSGDDRESRIDALVEHYRRELKGTSHEQN